MLDIQKERNKLRGSKFTFNLPDELADKMKREFMKAKKIADLRVEQERIVEERRAKNLKKQKGKDKDHSKS